MTFIRFCLFMSAALFLSPSVADESSDSSLDETFERGVLVIQAGQNACLRFDIYLATTLPQQRRGLMHVRELDKTFGMLFVYKRPARLSMWMKNTYIPLDIAFARADGSITNIVHDTEPLSLKSLSSTEPVTYVLELNAGVAQNLGIDENSRLIWGPMLDDDE